MIPTTEPKSKKLGLPGMSAANLGSEYTVDEAEFLRAMASWRQRNRRYPTMIEILNLARGIGYERTPVRPIGVVGEPQPLAGL